MCRWGRERGDTAEKVGWDREPLYAMTLKDHGTPIDVSFCIGRLEWKAPDSPRSPSLWEFLKGVPIAAFEKRNPVLSIWSVYTLITLIPMMHLLLVLDNFDLCLLGRQGEAVASHHFVGLRIFGCLFLFSGPVSLSLVGHLHLRAQACSQAHFEVQEELAPASPSTSALSFI